MNRTALTRLAQLLRKPLPKGVDRFDMGGWFHKQEGGVLTCAAGLAANHPWFIKRGFKLDPHGRPMFGATRCAIEGFFDLTTYEAIRIFAASSYKRGSRLDVARRIEGFVKRGKV